MLVFIHGIPLASDPSLSWEEVNNIVEELVHTWNWEGRKLGKLSSFAIALGYVFTLMKHPSRILSQSNL